VKIYLEICLGVLFAAEVQFLREPYEDYIDEKPYKDDFPYSPSNSSHLQLTQGRGRLPHSEL
jgi:hypothetical protein